MLQGQAPYGNSRSQIDDGILAIGRNLWATLPEDRYDHGPQSRSKFRLVADIRIDNRPELVARLGIQPSDSRRMPDAALLFELLLKWGHGAVNYLVGEFAFAFWDGDRQSLLLGRDIFGHRPLYFHRGANFFAFASMPSGLHALSEVPYDFNTDFMLESLALLPHVGRSSYFKDIERVEPAHIVRVTRDGLEPHKYWQPPAPLSAAAHPKDYEEGLRSVFDQAVAAQLRGAGDTVGTHLSGGLDSSIVTTSAAKQLPSGKVIAFTATPRTGFEGAAPRGTIASEAHLAAATASQYPNIEHVLVENNGGSPLEGLDRSFFYQQQPAANICNAVWGRAIHRAASERGLNTLLKGSAGNLSISYSGLEWLPFLLARGQLLSLFRNVVDLARNGMPLSSLGAQTLGPFLPLPLWRALRWLQGRTAGLSSYSAGNPSQLSELQRKAATRAMDLSGRPRRDPYEARLWGLTRHDGGNFYKGVLAEWGLSIREPAADKRVIEYCLAVPFEEYVRGGVPRSLARRAFSARLPQAVAGLRQRGYQSADWYENLGRDLEGFEREIDTIARCAGASDALDLEWLRETLRSWPQRGWDRQEVIGRYRWGLLRGISAGHFMRKVRGTN